MTPPPDEVALRGVAVARERAWADYCTHRNTARLEAAMVRLDGEQQRIRAQADDILHWPEILAVMRDMPAMWDEATDDERRVLASELFSSIDAIGGHGLRIAFRSGVQAVAMVGATGFEPATS